MEVLHIVRMYGLMQNNMPTLRELIDYSKQNPNTDVAKNVYRNIQQGSFDAQAQTEGIDLSWAGRPAPKPQPTPLADQTQENPLFKPSPHGDPNAIGANIANAVTSSEQNYGKDIAQGFYLAFGGQKNIDNVTQQYLDNASTMANLAKKQTDQTLKLKYARMAADDINEAQKVGKSVIGNNRTPAQIVGDAVGVGADLILAGNAAPAIAQVKTGVEALKAGETVLDAAKLANAIAPSFKLLSAADKAALAAKGIQSAAEYSALSKADKLKFLAKETALNTVKGAGIGYTMDVSKNLQSGETGGNVLKPGLGTAIGAAVPLVIGGVKITKAALKTPENAGRVVNSLIKPLQKDFAYGKDPGKTVAEMGITGNSLDDLGAKVNEAKKSVGTQLGDITSQIEGKQVVDVTSASQPLDDAIAQARKLPKTNSALIERLQNVKNDLFDKPALDHGLSALEYNGIAQVYNHSPEAAQYLTDLSLESNGSGIPKALVDAHLNGGKIANIDLSGVTDVEEAAQKMIDALPENLKTPEVVSDLERWGKTGQQITDSGGSLSHLTFRDAIDMKGTIGDVTKWTGNPSDDKIVNKALKQTYGKINNEILSKAGVADPAIQQSMIDLNEKYGGLISAENAIKHRDMILQRQNLITMPVKVGTVTGAITALATGGAAVPAILSGIGAGILDKALGSAAVKTRVASWLANESPGVVEKVYQANPAIRNILIKLGTSGQ